MGEASVPLVASLFLVGFVGSMRTSPLSGHTHLGVYEQETSRA